MESWRLCARWLGECGALPYDHRIMMETAEAFDLGQTLRDGVILCHLLNHIRPGSIDTLELSNIRTQTSQFLCMKNIRTFLRGCSRVFRIREADSFDPAWLFQMTNFGSLIDLLSKLSHTDDAIRTGATPFSPEEEDIYGGLEDLADEHDLADEGDIYDTVEEDEEDKIYDDLVNIRREIRTTTSRHQSEPKRDHRDFCLNEIVETELKYVDALAMLCNHFIKPLKQLLPRQDIDMIFLNVEELLRRHRSFYKDLQDAYTRNSPSMAQAFKKHKNQFLIYGFYCSHMLSAQNHIEKVSANQMVRGKIEECQMKANNNRFRLRDLLSVPMQRILKYHLLLKELVKHTDKANRERKELDEALDEMQDLSLYVNEVKRDHELMQTNDTIQASLAGYRGESLNEFGRTQKDGELKLKFSGKKSGAASKYCFLFDKVMLVCNKSGRGQESHEYHCTLDLAQYRVENDLPSGRSGKWNWCFHLTPREPSSNRERVVVNCKTEEMMMRWVEGIKLAQDNIQPRNCKGHNIEYTSFKESTTCDTCTKLLRGLFFQGYKCTVCGICVHKECLISDNTAYCKAAAAAPSPEAGATLRATKSYKGTPMPPYNEQPVIFNSGEMVQVLESVGPQWKRVKLMKPPHIIGLAPSSHLSENYEQTRPMFRPPHPQPGPGNGDRGSVNVGGGDQGAPEIQGLFAFPWYVGEMERPEANEKLLARPGSFLVRKGKKGYAASLQHEDQIKHMKIVIGSNNKFGLTDQTTFSSLPEMIDYYSRNSLDTVFKGLHAYLRKPYRSPAENGLKAKRYNIIGHAKAMYDFSARDTRELTLRENEMVQIISKAGGHRGWWKGCVDDRVGYFPSTYVEEIDNGAPTF